MLLTIMYNNMQFYLFTNYVPYYLQLLWSSLYLHELCFFGGPVMCLSVCFFKKNAVSAVVFSLSLVLLYIITHSTV